MSTGKTFQLHHFDTLSGNLSLKSLEESDSVGRELADTLRQLVGGHLVLVKVETEGGLVVKVGGLGNVESLGSGSIQLLGDGLGGRVQLLQETGRNGQKVDTSKLLDLARVSERGAHDNCLVSVLLVVVENALDRVHTRVLSGSVGLASGSLVPVQNAADKGRNQSGLGLGSSNGLNEREEQGKVDVNAVLSFELAGGLDTLVSGGNLDEDTVLADSLLLVELDNLESLSNGALLVKGESGIDLGRDTSGDNLENLGAKLDKQKVEGLLSLLGSSARGLGGGGHGAVNESSVLGLFRSGENQRRVGGGVLGLVLGNG